jgi:hydroxylaminobenzene mutase
MLREAIVEERAPKSSRASSSSSSSPSSSTPSPSAVTYTPLQRRLAKSAAALFAIGMLTGFWSGAALAEVVKVPIPRLALAAHLNCIMGCFWLMAVAFTLPMLGYSDKGKERLAKLTLVPAYGNWAITLLASFLGVRGINFTGHRANDFIAVLLFAFVVGPAVAQSFAWVYGFIKKPTA